MITLKIEDYCQNCPDFEPVVERIMDSMYDSISREVKSICNTCITCKDREKCERIANNLKQRIYK